MQRTIDYSALLDPIDPAALRVFKQESRSSGRFSTSMNSAWTLAIVLVVAGFMIVSLFGTMATDFGHVALPGLLLPLIALVGITGYVLIRSLASPWSLRYRLDRFAGSNGLSYASKSSAPAYPGAIFSLGRARHSRDHLRSVDGRFLDYGNYRYTTGSGKQQRTVDWGFLALHLDRSLPHMVLDSRSNNGLFGTNLPLTFARDQRLSLEGDFDEHFTLYCPKEYERDALYVFTPDLMALLIDNAAPFDVEIIDRWMFVYSARPFDMASATVHQRLMRIVDTVGAKTLSQTERYRDERVGDFANNIVAAPGRRLRKGISVASIVVVGAIVVFWVGPMLLRAVF